MATPRIVEQQWHIVCGSIEIEELQRQGLLKPRGRNVRYDLFLKIKHPNTEFYKGGWGPEILYFSEEDPYRGPVGRVFCTYARYRHISEWFLEAMSR